MHLLMSLFSRVGCLYGDAGLKQLLSEPGVYAPGSIHQRLSGKDFDRARHGLLLVDEALNKRFLLQFKRWCGEAHHLIPHEVNEVLSAYSEDIPMSDVVTAHRSHHRQAWRTN